MPAGAAAGRLEQQTRLALIALVVLLFIGGAVCFYFWRHPDSLSSRSSAAPTSGTPGTSSSPTPPISGTIEPAAHLFLGNPSSATADESNRDNFLAVRKYFTLSYNDSKGTPNWVSWRVTQADFGIAKRKNEFDSDTSLPASLKQITHRDYTGSGFDRGHMCPHSDRAANLDMSYATFVMTNIIPQAANVNQKAWREEEEYLRDLVKSERVRLYVIAGPVGQGGRGLKGFTETIAGGRITVPSACWKVAVAVPDTGVDDASLISSATRVISVIMKNDNQVVTGDAWAQYRVSPAEIERQTGYRFFDRLPADVADALRQKVDDVYVAPPKPHSFQRE